jgi:hypothetical protein
MLFNFVVTMPNNDPTTVPLLRERALRRRASMEVVALDARRDPHPQREERLKAAPPIPHQEMQQLMREGHENRDVRARVIVTARKKGMTS